MLSCVWEEMQHSQLRVVITDYVSEGLVGILRSTWAIIGLNYEQLWLGQKYIDDTEEDARMHVELCYVT